MKDETPYTAVGDEALEARIVAWVLGEASAFEAEEMEKLCADRAELKVFERRMRALHGLMGQAEKGGQDEEWKLPAEKRRAVEALWTGDVDEVAREKRVRKSGRRALLAIAACVVLALLVVRFAPWEHEGKVVIEVRPQTSRMSPLGQEAGDAAAAGKTSPQFFGTESEKIKSRRTLERVVENLDLEKRWDVDKEAALGILKKKVKPEQVKGTDLFAIKVRDANEKDANEIANEVATSYRAYRSELDRDQLGRELKELGKAVRNQEDKVEERRKVLATIERSKGKKPDPRAEAIKRGLDAQDFVDAKREFELDQELLRTMKLRQNEKAVASRAPKAGVIIHERAGVGSEREALLPDLRGMVALETEFPAELIEGTPKPMKVPNLVEAKDGPVVAGRDTMTRPSVAVRGQVGEPGQLALTPGMTLEDAVQASGGATEFGSTRRVEVMRDGETKRVNLAKNEGREVKLNEGDIVYLPQKTAWGDGGSKKEGARARTAAKGVKESPRRTVTRYAGRDMPAAPVAPAAPVSSMSRMIAGGGSVAEQPVPEAEPAQNLADQTDGLSARGRDFGLAGKPTGRVEAGESQLGLPGGENRKSRAVTSNFAEEDGDRLPVPETMTGVTAVEFGDGDDFGTGWGGVADAPIEGAVRKRKPGESMEELDVAQRDGAEFGFQAGHDQTRAMLLADFDQTWELPVSGDESKKPVNSIKLGEPVVALEEKAAPVDPFFDTSGLALGDRKGDSTEFQIKGGVDAEYAFRGMDLAESNLRFGRVGATEERLLREVRFQEEKVEQRRKVLATIIRTKGIIYKGEDSFYGASGVNENAGARNALHAFHQLEQEKMQLEAQISSLSKYDGEQLMVYASGLDVPDNIIRKNYPQYLELKRQVEGLKVNGLGDVHPTVLAAKRQMDEIKALMDEGVVNQKAALKVRFDRASERLAGVEKMRNEFRASAISRGLDAQDYVDAKNEFEADQRRLMELKQQLAGLSEPVVPKVDPRTFVEEVSAAEEPYSTFSLNISDASFQVAQAALARGEQPDPAGIKVEQFYNAVDYGDPAPVGGEPVAVSIEQSAHPVIPGRNLVRVAVKTAAAGRGAEQPLRLTLLVDQSGSMVREDRRAAMDRALDGLAELLTDRDKVTVVGFSRTPRLLADGMAGDQAGGLSDLLNQGASEGGTNLEQAIGLAGQLAERSLLDGAQNRIVLFTDGAANLGDADPERLADKVKELRQKGVAFDIAGIAADDLNDGLLGGLARHGNGRYYVVGKGGDADFAKQLAGAFRPAAENVKVQVRFNPERVRGYKLIGFEKDRLKTEDFRNDAVDAAEMAAEEAGVAIYQVEPLARGSGEIGEVSVRFRDAAGGGMVERTWTVPHDAGAPAFDRASPSMQLAVMAMLAGEKLRGGPLGDAVDFRKFGEAKARVRAFYGAAGRAGEVMEMVGKLGK